MEAETRWAMRRRYAGRDRVALLLSAEDAAARSEDPDTPSPLAKALRTILAFEERGFPTVAQVAARAKVPQNALQELAEAGWVELFDLLPARLGGRASPLPHRSPIRSGGRRDFGHGGPPPRDLPALRHHGFG